MLYDIYISISTSFVLIQFLYVNPVPLTFNDVYCLNDNSVLAMVLFKHCLSLYMSGYLEQFHWIICIL